MKTLAERICARLHAREDFEDSPYYKGRYLVAANTVRNAARGLSLPYEVAEVLFQESRYAAKIDAWLQDRKKQFEHWEVLPDGSIGCRIEETLPAKKKPQSEKSVRFRRESA